MKQYKYLGDRFTAPELKGKLCVAVLREDGKCIRGKNGSMLVEFDGIKTVVVGRLLRKIINQGGTTYK
jgi:hypothetical protein